MSCCYDEYTVYGFSSVDILQFHLSILVVILQIYNSMSEICIINLYQFFVFILDMLITSPTNPYYKSVPLDNCCYVAHDKQVSLHFFFKFPTDCLLSQKLIILILYVFSVIKIHSVTAQSKNLTVVRFVLLPSPADKT